MCVGVTKSLIGGLVWCVFSRESWTSGREGPVLVSVRKKMDEKEGKSFRRGGKGRDDGSPGV